jgi:GDP-4-dehydro-6-deoxy-D-mannose reductase
MKNILITGVTGFVGSHMADYILKYQSDYKLWGTKRYHLSRTDNIEHLENKIEMIDVNLLESSAVIKLIKNIKPDKIFHFAAESFVSPSWDHPVQYMKTNYEITVNLLEAIKNYSPHTIFHIPGSGEEYGEISEKQLPINLDTGLNPVNPYAVTKIAQDLIGFVYYKSYGAKVIRTRAFNHEGPRRENVFGIPWYAYQLVKIENGLQNKIIKVGHIDDKRNFTHVLDMVRAYWEATEKCKFGDLYLVGSMDERNVATFREILLRMIDYMSLNDVKIVEDEKYVRPTNVPFLIADTSKFNLETGWEPKLNLDDIISDTINYWRKKIGNKYSS